MLYDGAGTSAGHPPFMSRRLVAVMQLYFRARKRAATLGGGASPLPLASAGTAAANPFGWWATQPHPFAVTADHGVASRDGPVTGNLLANDFGATAVVRHSALSDPSAGQLTVNADGSYSFVPAAGTHGPVSSSYTATDAVTLYKDAVPGGGKTPPMGELEGPNGTTTFISGGGYSSHLPADPGPPGGLYGVP